MATPDLADLSRRPARYWHVDGLPELMLGLLWMLWGGAWLVGERLPHDWRWTVYWLLVPPALAIAATAITRMTHRLKDRVTVPRTGYVAWQAPSTRRRVLAAAVIVVAAVAVALVVLTGRAASVERTAPAVITAILSLSFLAIAVRQQAPHFLAFAAAAVVTALVLATIVTGFQTIHWLFLVLGAVCAAVGAFRLARFVRRHPPIAAEGL
jgi:hypothetical protein